MARKRAKKRVPTTKEEDKNSEHALAVDRISTLPDCVIHHILSFVPMVDAVGMSLLSRRWRRMWHSVPAMKFFYPRFGPFQERQVAFNVFVERCLKYRRGAMRYIDGSAVTTLKLESDCSPKLLAGLGKWFGSDVIMKNITDLDICLNKNGSQNPYSLPFALLNGRSLTHLHLEGDLMIGDCSVNLPSLKSLRLREIGISRDALYNLLDGCPSLEKCVLYSTGVIFYYELHLRISSPTFSFLEIELYECDELKIESSNLQSLRLNHILGIDFSFCKEIRDLTIADTDFEAEKLMDQISQLPLLENLTLDCGYFDQLKFSSQTLKHLTVYEQCLDNGDGNEIVVAVDAPNLVSFCFIGGIRVRMSKGLLNHPAKAEFSVWGSSLELINFFSNINPNWTSFDLHLSAGYRVKSYDLPKNIRQIDLPPWNNLKHMKVKFPCKWTRKADLRNFLKRLAPSLETLSIE